MDVRCTRRGARALLLPGLSRAFRPGAGSGSTLVKMELNIEL